MAASTSQGTCLNGLWVKGLDTKATGAVSMGLTPNNGLTFTPSEVMVHCTAADSISVGASISVGTNSSNYDNILPITVLTGFSATNQYWRFPLATSIAAVVAANVEVFVKVTTAATGTSQTITCMLTGDYYNAS